MDGINGKSFIVSVVIHVTAVLTVLLTSLTGGCLSSKKEQIVPMEFIIVTEENAADRLAETPNDVKEEPEPEPLPEPPALDPLPPPPPIEIPDPIPPPPPLVEKKSEPKKPDSSKEKEEKKLEKKVEKKPEKKSKPKIKIGERVGPITTGKKDPKKAATEKKVFSDTEIKKLLGQGAKTGNKNRIPPNEALRWRGAIVAAFKEKCDAYGLEEPSTGRRPILKVVFGSGGRVTSITILQSSGDRTFDQRALQACRQVKRVILPDSFLSEYKIVEIELQ